MSELEILREKIEREKREKRRGRPRINREVAYKIIQQIYSMDKDERGRPLTDRRRTYLIMDLLGVSARTVRQLKKEMKEKGISLKKEEIPKLTKEEEEILRESKKTFKEEVLNFEVRGENFIDWLKRKAPKSWKRIFNWTRRMWLYVYGKPPLMLLANKELKIADEVAQKWLKTFDPTYETDPVKKKEKLKRIRGRLKLVRYLWRYLDRGDINDRYFTIQKEKHPEAIREIPEITFPDFPVKLQKAIDYVELKMGGEAALALKFKIVTGLRTGKRGEERELMGLIVGEPNGSYIIIRDGEVRSRISAKMRETWTLNRIPPSLLKELKVLYSMREPGEPLFQFSIDKLRKVFKEGCVKAGLPPLTLHDLRKVGLTWLWVLGVDLVIAININVGWKDLNTAYKHYLMLYRLIRRDVRREYAKNIPLWFKEGIEEYIQAPKIGGGI